MMKLTKKFIAIMLTLVFVLSLVPFSAMAEVQEGNYVNVTPLHYGYIRACKSKDETVSYYEQPAEAIYTDYAVARHSTLSDAP